MKRYMICLLIALLAGLLYTWPALADEASDIDVTQYSYTVKPVFSSYFGALYVQTDNPNPLSFRLNDPENRYALNKGTSIWQVWDALYANVQYEDPARFRVKGGYIFTTRRYSSDGGTLILQQRVASSSGSYTYKDTEVTVECPQLLNTTDSAIREFTRDDMGFFKKLDAIQAGLDQYAGYPHAVKDADNLNSDHPYPALAVSGYQDVGLNLHLENVFNAYPDGMLLLRAYPYVLDSASFPSLIASAAQ